MGKSKKELDRDMMFRKIMPALADNPFSTLVVEEDVPEPEQSKPPEISMSASESNPSSLSISSLQSQSPPADVQAAPQAIASPDADLSPLPGEGRTVSKRLIDYPMPPEEQLDDDLSILRTRLFGRPTVSAESISTINLMETLVLKHLDDVIQRFNCCRCDRCRRDIAAYALNQLPAQYVVADLSNIDAIAPLIPKNDIFNALVKAVLQVRTHPRH